MNSTFKNQRKFYTDGSHHRQETGAAFVTNEEVFKYHLPDTASNFTAEAYSLFKASEYVRNNEERSYVIYTDYLSLLEAVNVLYTQNTLIQKIQDNLHSAKTQGKHVTLVCQRSNQLPHP